MGTRSDEHLVAAARAGDRRALDELVRRHELRVWRIARGVVGRDADASDVAQETWIAVVRNLDAFAGTARFTTWLHRIALTKSYDALRARGRAAPPVESSASAERCDEVDGFERSAQEQALLAALARLDEPFRAAVVLVDVCGASVEEAAASLDVAVGTVKSRVFRGRAQLARRLGTELGRDASHSVEEP